MPLTYFSSHLYLSNDARKFFLLRRKLTRNEKIIVSPYGPKTPHARVIADTNTHARALSVSMHRQDRNAAVEERKERAFAMENSAGLLL